MESNNNMVRFYMSIGKGSISFAQVALSIKLVSNYLFNNFMKAYFQLIEAWLM